MKKGKVRQESRSYHDTFQIIIRYYIDLLAQNLDMEYEKYLRLTAKLAEWEEESEWKAQFGEIEWIDWKRREREAQAHFKYSNLKL